MSKSEFPITIFTDGACSGNPGPGGWGAVIVTTDGKVTELGGKAHDTTNNEMELMGCVRALEEIREVAGPVNVYTDSTYVIRGITQWIWAWRNRGWKTAEGKDVSNQVHWKKLSGLVAGRNPKPEWKYVRGHQGTPGNERVDEIATRLTQGKHVDFYRGPLLQYSIEILDIPDDTSLPEMRPKEEKKAALFYLSLVNGELQRHTTWKDCEGRVKGRPGAKFKKVMTEEDEGKIKKEWGLS